MAIFYTNTIISNDVLVTGSVIVSGSLIVTSSNSVNINFTGSLLGSSSFALSSATSSFITASNIFNGNTPSSIISSSISLTSSNFTKANYASTLKFSEGVTAARALGSDILFESVAGTSANLGAARSGLSGTAYGSMILITYPSTITGVCFSQGGQGVYTANNYNGVALYKLTDTSTYTFVASSSNDGNIWKFASNTYGSASLSSPYSANPGIYIVLGFYNSSAQTTAPIFTSARKISATNPSSLSWRFMSNTNTLLSLYMSISSATTPPSTITSFTSLGFSVWYALY